MRININDAAQFIRAHDEFILLTHSNPDGDTIGSACALARGLDAIGKKAVIRCGDDFPEKFTYLFEGLADSGISHESGTATLIAVDVASPSLLGEKYQDCAESVALCIDHHPSNTLYAERTLLDDTAAAAAEIIYELLNALSVNIDPLIADAIYTAVSTDTGCFRYGNTTARTHLIAAEMISHGCRMGQINRFMFETKTAAQLRLEMLCLNSLEYHFDGKCALACITREMLDDAGANDGDCDSIAALPRQSEGVLVGILLRQKKDGSFKASLRTYEPVNASAICAVHGGGGHLRAAGCTFKCGLEDARTAILSTVGNVLRDSL